MKRVVYTRVAKSEVLARGLSRISKSTRSPSQNFSSDSQLLKPNKNFFNMVYVFGFYSLHNSAVFV